MSVGSIWSSMSYGSRAFVDGVSGNNFLHRVPLTLWVSAQAMLMPYGVPLLLWSDLIWGYSDPGLGQRTGLIAGGGDQAQPEMCKGSVIGIQPALASYRSFPPVTPIRETA